MTVIKTANLFDHQPSAAAEEEFIPLLQTEDCRLEQIISHGQATPPGEWYDQPDPEWALLVRGHATLKYEAGESCELRAGDYLLIPARVRHRVEACSEDAIWLALHYHADQETEGASDS